MGSVSVAFSGLNVRVDRLASVGTRTRLWLVASSRIHKAGSNPARSNVSRFEFHFFGVFSNGKFRELRSGIS